MATFEELTGGMMVFVSGERGGDYRPGVDDYRLARTTDHHGCDVRLRGHNYWPNPSASISLTRPETSVSPVSAGPNHAGGHEPARAS
ncbi:hypothetical protein GCM10009799_43660 [Nocardiopsis rhodophaea]|uniref:Uncharacterized protein n=1 Tax=Nocardiopsis rhodophaea TaxID=280238 RepID=A0ABN2TIN9_9ACTN